MGLLTILKKVKEEEKEIRLLILGLDNAGKTSMTKQLLGQPLDTIEPTLGFSIQTLDYYITIGNGGSNSGSGSISDTRTTTNLEVPPSEGQAKKMMMNNTDNGNNNDAAQQREQEQQRMMYRLHLWDIGGQSSIRAYWRNYFEKTDGLIFVIDSTDQHRMDLVQEELSTLLQQERLQGATLLVLANKQDLKDALTSEEIATALQLNSKIQYQNRHWAIHGCSAMTGQGLSEAMEWLVQDITSRIFLF